MKGLQLFIRLHEIRRFRLQGCRELHGGIFYRVRCLQGFDILVSEEKLNQVSPVPVRCCRSPGGGVQYQATHFQALRESKILTVLKKDSIWHQHIDCNIIDICFCNHIYFSFQFLVSEAIIVTVDFETIDDIMIT